MSYQTFTFNNTDELRKAVIDLLVSWRLHEKCHEQCPVLLVSSLDAQLYFRQALATGPLSWGVRVETFNGWLTDRWELYGDGRVLVRPSERMLLLQRCCEFPSDAKGGFAASFGVLSLLTKLVCEALPALLSVQKNDDIMRELTPMQGRILSICEQYASLLDVYGRCELSQAADSLADVLVDFPPILLVGFDDISYTYQAMLQTLSCRGRVIRFDDACRLPDAESLRVPELQEVLTYLFKPSFQHLLTPQGSVRFLLPAGAYARSRLIFDSVVQAVDRAKNTSPRPGRDILPVMVAALHPRRVFDDIAGALARKGIVSALRSRRLFGDTAFGRAWYCLLSFLYDSSYTVFQAADFALSVFSGIHYQRACMLDAAWRGNRTITREQIIDDMSASSKLSAQVLEALSRHDIDAALLCFENNIRYCCTKDEAFCAEQLAAISAARDWVRACRHVNADAATSFEALMSVSIAPAASMSYAEGHSNPDVVFLSLEEAAQCFSCSCSTLVLCDFEAVSYPVHTLENEATLLLDKLGFSHVRDALMHMRHTFFRAISCARDMLIVERVLNTEDAEEAYPSVMYEELLDCYVAHNNHTALDGLTGLPLSFMPYVYTAGEEMLYDNLSLCTGFDRPKVDGWHLLKTGEVSDVARLSALLGCRVKKGSTHEDTPVLSPSAIETFLECPYKWFVQRRLHPSRPDADFGPLEMGSFAHSVLKSFYERFRASGKTKVNETNIEYARDLMGSVFDQCQSAQRTLAPACHPLIAQTKLEEAEMNGLRKNLLSYLDREMRLLPDFVPTYFEFAFGFNEPFSYAGCLLRGSIDRIDVNEKNQAVVIDYKGSVNDDYLFTSASPLVQAGSFMLPHKVQTLIYAQVVQRLLGLQVVGALYVSYGSVAGCAGCFDRYVLGKKELLDIKVDACGVPAADGSALGARDFQELLDMVEARTARALQAIQEGRITPCPRGTDPCTWCPVLTCERRYDL